MMDTSTYAVLNAAVKEIKRVLQFKQVALAVFAVEVAFDKAKIKTTCGKLREKSTDPSINCRVTSLLEDRKVMAGRTRYIYLCGGVFQGSCLSRIFQLWYLVIDRILAKIKLEGFYVQIYAGGGLIIVIQFLA